MTDDERELRGQMTIAAYTVIAALYLVLGMALGWVLCRWLG